MCIDSFSLLWMLSCTSNICWTDYFFTIALPIIGRLYSCRSISGLSSGSIDLAILLPTSHHLYYCSFRISLDGEKCQSTNFVLHYCEGILAFLCLGSVFYHRYSICFQNCIVYFLNHSLSNLNICRLTMEFLLKSEDWGFAKLICLYSESIAKKGRDLKPING